MRSIRKKETPKFKDDDWKIAIEDARFRHNAVLGLIYAADNQAMGLLRLYLTIALATSTGAASSLLEGSKIPPTIGFSLLAVTATLIWSSWQCFKTIEVADINMPGRGAEFWLWAADNNIERKKYAYEYLKTLAEKHKLNNQINNRQTRALRRAKLGGISSPVIAFIAGAITTVLQWYSIEQLFF